MERLDKNAAVSCSLNDEEFRDRRALARRTLIPKIESCDRTGDILLFTFYQSSDLRQTIEDFVTLEQQCCGFLTFKIIDVDDGQPTALKISGPPEASATIDIFAAAVQTGRS
ncbi:hypothetical protein [Parasphingorhabdus halotolerans]|uniref:Uncharacterized protein n=1 Tax=Parasphingorhabdus halotolerans TaxID=2725558 RepID=A0A6H2DLN0_9SPHN|nr:hypothetical protein [Parasphingorhabdus halotolerans]QJB69037.1 hypothetical protein HF685_06865 [Parasphingorhabdus halotolerans]